MAAKKPVDHGPDIAACSAQLALDAKACEQLPEGSPTGLINERAVCNTAAVDAYKACVRKAVGAALVVPVGDLELTIADRTRIG
jgi:hypothetical protein